MHRLCSKSHLFCKNYNPFLVPTVPFAQITFISRFSNISEDPSPHFSPNHAQYNSRFGVRFAQLDDNPQNRTAHGRKYDEIEADVEKLYKILRKFHTRVPKLELALDQSGVVMRDGLTERVINRCGDAGNLAFWFFEWASRQPGYRHTFDVYMAMIKTLSKMRQFGAVWAIIEEMRKENPHMVTPEVFVVLLRRFASANMVKKAIEVLDEMPKYGCEPDEHVFGCLLDSLCKNGWVKDAANLIGDMEIRFPPNIKYFTSLLYGWCREGRLMEAKFVLMQMKKAGFAPDVVVFNNLLNGYCTAGMFADAYDLLKEMRRQGCEPNVASYTLLIQALCHRDRSAEAIVVFNDMEKIGCVPDIMTYNALVNGLCKRGKIDKAYQLLDTMIRRGQSPDQLTYLYLLFVHEKKNELQECLTLVEEMKKIGCGPDSKIYHTLLRLALKLGEAEEGIRLWNDMEASRLTPAKDSFIMMVHGLTRQGKLVEACDIFKEMVNRGLNYPQYETLNVLLNTLLRTKRLDMAKDVWDYMVAKGFESDVSAWTIWIHALFSKGHAKEACDYCLEMIDADVMPQVDTFAKLMEAVKNLYERHVAVVITDRVRKMAADRKVTFKMYKRRGVRDWKEKEKAQEKEKAKRLFGPAYRIAFQLQKHKPGQTPYF